MHPPFYLVDHRIDPQSYYPLEERRIVRRSQPEVLRLSLPGPGAPLVSYRDPAPVALASASGGAFGPQPGASLARSLHLLATSLTAGRNPS